MNLKGLFKSADNMLEGSNSVNGNTIKTEEKTLVYECPNCKCMLTKQGVRENAYSCPECQFYFKIGARKRIQMYADQGSFHELYKNLESKNLLDFPEYDQKLNEAKRKSGELEGVICGTMTIGGKSCAIFSMDANFMMGSMGTVVGEKITSLFEYATSNHLPVIGVTVSGGARMQEGMLSLIQMAKVSGAVKKHSDAELLYIVMMTNPTTGGVEASFAMEGDIILAEPNALIGFAGPRVIQATLKKKLPKGFQRSEALLKCGFVDEIVTRQKQKEYLDMLLFLHKDTQTVKADGGNNDEI